MHPAFSVFLFLLPLVSALTISISANPASGGSVTITWTATSSDPQTFSLELSNPSQFHNAIAIGNNVQTSLGTITVNLPNVPATDGYTLEAVQVSNINEVYATSNTFSIGATVTTTSSASTSSPLSSSSGSVASSAGSSVSTASSSSSSSASSSSSGSSTSPSPFNGSNGALGSHIDGGHIGSMAVAVVGIVAGAVLV
ncbi:hypothetical protein BJV74DRAFT_880776 [Russula compacta]|nr:hypothetical protein BJV74DRAFT_880776 [Russula compacta]